MSLPLLLYIIYASFSSQLVLSSLVVAAKLFLSVVYYLAGKVGDSGLHGRIYM